MAIDNSSSLQQFMDENQARLAAIVSRKSGAPIVFIIHNNAGPECGPDNPQQIIADIDVMIRELEHSRERLESIVQGDPTMPDKQRGAP